MVTKPQSPKSSPLRTNNVLTPTKTSTAYKDQLSEALFGTKISEAKVLSLKMKPPKNKGELTTNPHSVLYAPASAISSSTLYKGSSKSCHRYLNRKEVRILDAPNLLNNYYSNTIDWGDHNVLAIALGCDLYLWDAESSHTCLLMTTESSNPITSVSWSNASRYLAVATEDGAIQLWDAEGQRLLRKMTSHSARVGSLSWNSSILSSGSG
jgi:cell division cycle protein 20 (cofactor of APC complex)